VTLTPNWQKDDECDDGAEVNGLVWFWFIFDLDK